MGSVQGFQERSQKVEEPTVAAPQTNGLAKAAKATTAAVAASEEVVLLAWLIVLLRTREDQQFAFEWAYRTGTGAEQTGWGPVMRVLASEVVPELSIRLNQAASAIASRIAACSPKTSPPVDGAGPVSLLLSTGALSSRGSSKGDGEEGKKDEVRAQGGCHLLPFFDDVEVDVELLLLSTFIPLTPSPCFVFPSDSAFLA